MLQTKTIRNMMYGTRNRGGISKISVIHHGGNEDSPYEIVDVTAEALKQIESISNNIKRLNTIAAEQEKIKYEPGEQCDSPYVCWYKQYCRQTKE